MKQKMWHCKNCGNLCDTSNGVCPGCGFDLGFYGEVQFVDIGDDAAPLPPPPQQQAAPPPPLPPQPQQEKSAKQKKAKEPKPPKGGKKGGKLPIIIGGAMVLIVVLVIGCFSFRTSVDNIRFRTIRDWEDSYSGDVYYVGSSASGTQEIVVSYKGFLGTQPELEVASSDSSVVQVSAVSGGDDSTYTVTLRAKSPGTAKITAQAGDERKSYTIQVYEITGVKLQVPGLLNEISLGVGDYEIYYTELEYSGEIDEKYLPDVEVTSSDPDVVEVDSESRKLVTKGIGSAEITASAGDYEESITVNVFEITAVELDLYDLLVDANGNTIYWLPQGLTMGVNFFYYHNGETGTSLPYYTLESSNEEVISVDPRYFTITAVGPGKATITATMGGHSDSVTLDVYPVDRSSGAWVQGSIDSIAAPAAGSTSEDYTVTICYGDGVNYITVLPRWGAGGSSSWIGDWDDITDQYPNESHAVHSAEMRIALKGSEWNQKRTIAGITFMFKRADADASYNPATDLIDYWVIYTE